MADTPTAGRGWGCDTKSFRILLIFIEILLFLCLSHTYHLMLLISIMKILFKIMLVIKETDQVVPLINTSSLYS